MWADVSRNRVFDPAWALEWVKETISVSFYPLIDVSKDPRIPAISFDIIHVYGIWYLIIEMLPLNLLGVREHR